MTDNTQRFAGRAENYDLYRQRYPAERVIAQLSEWCGLTPQWLVADIGAGTGMLAEVFLGNGNPVLAIEPNADMRDQMHKTFDGLGKCWPSFEIIDRPPKPPLCRVRRSISSVPAALFIGSI